MRLDRRLLVMCGALLLIAAEVPPALQRNDAPVFDINVAISPETHNGFELLQPARLPRRYRCIAFIHDEPGSRRVWGPSLVLRPGDTREASVDYAGLKATLKASLSADLSSAKTAVTIMRDGKIISRQVATMTLHRPPAAR